MPTQHNAILNADCHEPKHITDALTSDSGKVITPSSTLAGQSDLRRLVHADLSDTANYSTYADTLAALIANDQINYQGWEASQDSLSTPTIVVGTTPVRLTIDGLGSQSRQSHLPLCIRGSDVLWDTSTNKIKPCAAGDSYIVRISLTITATSGAPAFLTKTYDIGNNPTTITVPIINDDVNVTKTPPFSFARTQSIYTYDTAFANGVQIFLNTNTGTATIAARRIDIFRIGSGANGVVV